MNAFSEGRKRNVQDVDLNDLKSKRYHDVQTVHDLPVYRPPGLQYCEPPRILPPPFLRGAPACPPPSWGAPRPYFGTDDYQSRLPPPAPAHSQAPHSTSTSRSSLTRNRRVGGGLPKEWCEYTTHAACASVAGLRVAGVFPCKTFLSHSFEDRLAHPSSIALGEHRGRWRPSDAIEVAGCLKAWSTEKGTWVDMTPTSPRIAAVVNLTLTERYYDSRELEECGVEYYWLPADGGGSLPRIADIQQFLELFAYLSHKFPGRLIAMHCTHGVNRTGFYFSLLLMAFGGVPHSEAVNVFSRVRGHPINRGQNSPCLDTIEYGCTFLPERSSFTATAVCVCPAYSAHSENLIEGLAQLETALLPTPEFQSFMQHLKCLGKLADLGTPALKSTTHSSEPLVLDCTTNFDAHTAVVDQEKFETVAASKSERNGGMNDASDQEGQDALPEETDQSAKTQVPVKVLASYSLRGQEEANGEDLGEDSSHRSTNKAVLFLSDADADKQTSFTPFQSTAAEKLRDVFIRIQLIHPQQILIAKLYVELLRYHYCEKSGGCTGEANVDSSTTGPVASGMPLGIVGFEGFSGMEESEAPAEQPVSEEGSKSDSLSPQLFSIMFTAPLFACTAFNNCILKLTQEIPRLKSGVVQLCTQNAPEN